jgi:hypothetical protein
MTLPGVLQKRSQMDRPARPRGWLLDLVSGVSAPARIVTEVQRSSLALIIVVRQTNYMEDSVMASEKLSSKEKPPRHGQEKRVGRPPRADTRLRRLWDLLRDRPFETYYS